MWFRDREFKSRKETSTDIFVSDLPDEIGLFELGILLCDYAEHFTLKMVEGGDQRRICIATFDSERLAQKAVKVLRKSKFGKHRLEVHKYIHRAYSSERRDPLWRNRKWDSEERRNRERRQQAVLKPYREQFGESIEQTDGLDMKSLRIRGYDKPL